MNIFSSSNHNHTRRTAHRAAHRTAEASSTRRSSPSVAVGRHFSDEAEASAEGGWTSSLLAALFALPVAVLIGFLLLLITTAVAYTNADPDALTTPLSLVALGMTALMGGTVAGVRGYRHPLLSACFLGLMLLLLLLGGSLFYSDELRAQLSVGISALGRWGMRLSVLPLSLLGGRIGKKRDRERHRTHGHPGGHV